MAKITAIIALAAIILLLPVFVNAYATTHDDNGGGSSGGSSDKNVKSDTPGRKQLEKFAEGEMHVLKSGCEDA
jgi:hypothetical protein